uniref:Uncharacterized protein n=1 Tax=Arundo donax TaxID=35708 RepID=A0A0A9HJR5_ARUDO
MTLAAQRAKTRVPFGFPTPTTQTRNLTISFKCFFYCCVHLHQNP